MFPRQIALLLGLVVCASCARQTPNPPTPVGGVNKSLPVAEVAKRSIETAKLIERLRLGDRHERGDAAEALADMDDPKAALALRDHLAGEADFHVRLACRYALASHGDKQSLCELIDSLKQSGHLGAVYLDRVTDEDFGWNIASWKAWYKKTSDEEFCRLIERKRERRPMMEEWYQFVSMYGAVIFDDLDDRAENHVTEQKKSRLAQLPTALAWELYSSAINALQDDGDRQRAAKLFRQVATEYKSTYYAEESQELADLLDAMVMEDAAWTEPATTNGLLQDQQISYHVYHVRDVVAHQFTQPGYCHVLHPFFLGDERPNSAQELAMLGTPAIPALIKLLDDRRPIRAVGYWRHFHPTRTVLRYQDAAIQILDEILPDSAYEPTTTSSYFSNERVDRRVSIKSKIIEWWEKNKHKSQADLGWEMFPANSLADSLKILRRLAELPSEREQVLEKLRDMYNREHWSNQPRIAEVMAALGDESKVEETVSRLHTGKYRYLDSEWTAQRIEAQFGQPEQNNQQ